MTIEYRSELKKIIQNKINKEISDTDIEFAIDEVVQYILNYCTISDVPRALRFVVANMVIDLLSYQYYKKNQDNENPEDSGLIGAGNISNLQVGDTQVKLGNWDLTDSRTSALKSHVANLDEILFDYNKQLNQFRRTW